MGYKVVHTPEAVKKIFKQDNRFIIGIGRNPVIRENLMNQFENEYGGHPEKIVSNSAIVGKHNVSIGFGTSIMSNVIIENNVTIEKGCIVNNNSAIHHDSSVGSYTEIAPRATILGNVTIESNCFVGASSTILPNIIIGKGTTVGAGSVVTKNIAPGSTVVGVPAKPINS